MNKIDCIYKMAETAVATYLRCRYEVKHEGTLPKKEPYVLLPKHQKLLDIPLEGHFIRRTTGRTANYIMRGFSFPFNTFFEILGGIKVARPKDRRAGKLTKEQAEETNKEAETKALDCLAQGEPLIIHPEGTRHPEEMGQIRIKSGSILATIVEEQKHRGTIPFIPMGIEYQEKQIWVRAGQPYYTDNTQELQERLTKEIARLSNLQP